MPQWMISVRSNNSHKKIMVNSLEGEKDIDIFQRAKEAYLKLKQKYPQYTVELISRKKAFAPKKKPARGYYYCPFCRTDRKFQINNNTGYKHCPICGVSDTEYSVKTFNNLWGKAEL